MNIQVFPPVYGSYKQHYKAIFVLVLLYTCGRVAIRSNLEIDLWVLWSARCFPLAAQVPSPPLCLAWEAKFYDCISEFPFPLASSWTWPVASASRRGWKSGSAIRVFMLLAPLLGLPESSGFQGLDAFPSLPKAANPWVLWIWWPRLLFGRLLFRSLPFSPRGSNGIPQALLLSLPLLLFKVSINPICVFGNGSFIKLSSVTRVRAHSLSWKMLTSTYNMCIFNFTRGWSIKLTFQSWFLPGDLLRKS